MRQFLAAIAATLLLLSGCSQGDSSDGPVSTVQAADPAPEVFAIGTALTQTGAVSEESRSDQFVKGAELYVSVDVSSATSDQTIEIEWIDSSGSLVRSDRRRVPPSRGYAAFSSGPTNTWKRGRHRAVIVIDGRKVSEKEFSLI